VNVAGRLDPLPIGPFHRRLLLLSGLGWLFDSMDTGLVSFVLARLKSEWSLTSDQVALAGSIGLLGMLVGGAFGGRLADRYGRKAVFQWTLLLFSISTGLCALVPNFPTLLALRFAVGVGLGGELPVAASLVSEFAPAAQRGRLIVLLESFWAFGWAAAAAIADLLARVSSARGAPFPWRFAFLVGALPALYVFVLRRTLPESPRFLMARGRGAEAEAIVRQVEEASGRPHGASLAPEPPAPPARLGDLFATGLRRRTMVLWTLWFAMAFSYYGIFIWLPTLLVGRGFGEVHSFSFTLWITLAQIPGYFAAAFLVERIGRRATLAPFMILCAAASWGFGHAATSSSLLLWGCLVSFFNLGAWGVTYGYTPELYPTRLRATGTGSAAAFGRFGGVLAPLAVGRLLTMAATGGATGVGGAASGPAVGPAGADAGFAAIFTLFAVVLIVGALAVALFGEETRGRTLEKIAA